MYCNLSRAFVVLALVSIGGSRGVQAARAQEPAPPLPRPATKKVTPAYPEIARKAHLEGTVKVSVVVTQEGKVKSVAVTGGHPIFARAAAEAASQWQFTPAARESTQPLVFDFKSPTKQDPDRP